MNQQQDFTFSQLDMLLLSSNDIDEVRCINQVYSVISDMVIEHEVYCALDELDCPQNAIELVKSAIVAGVYDANNLKQVTKRIYAVIGEPYQLGISATCTKVQNAVEIMYLNNTVKIKELCGLFKPNRMGLPPAKVFMQAVARNVIGKKKCFECELRHMLNGIHIIGGNQVNI